MKSMILFSGLIISAVAFEAEAVKSSTSVAAVINITFGQVSVGDQMRGTYKGKDIAEVFVKKTQGSFARLDEHTRWQFVEKTLRIYKEAHEEITDVRVVVNGYAYPGNVQILNFTE